MRRGGYILLTLIAIAVLAAVQSLAQASQAPSESATPQANAKTAAAVKNWTPARTPDGQPDLQGVWDTASLTPLERPKELGMKAFYTPEEAAAFEKSRKQENNRDRRDGGAQTDVARAYNEGWFDRGSKLGRNLRTSRVIDPPDGRFPPFTPEAQKHYDAVHAYLEANPANGPEDRPLFERCLVFSQTGPPLIPGNYNNLYQIVQTPGSVTIFSEMGHQARTVPLDEHAKLPQNVTQWMGDSYGHWDGNTLVIETTNVRYNDMSHFGTQYDTGMSDRNMKVVERFTRTAPDLLIYRATVTDPTVYTKPWTIEIPMDKTESAIFEYACHEGNYGIVGILAGERAREKKLAEHR
ncbi:MAG TPA: hypothetical protein VGR73_16765 [Bryobacteraceae bacterium]|nr:hypothetical protein [Bryobacteraceae bacterium]